MTSNMLWLVVLGPLGLISACLLPTSVADRYDQMVNKLVRGLSCLSFIGALVSVGLVTNYSSLNTSLVGTRGVGLSLYLDSVSATMFTLVSFIGWIVVSFSRNYLAGDPGRGRFTKRMAMALGSILFLIVAGNFFQFLVAWISTSIALHQLLTFYSERPSAILAARKKWVVSRLGDVCLLGAIVLLYSELGSLDYAVVFKAAREAQATSVMATAFYFAAPLLALAALLKSAQFPIHGWLLEVMETPTPISALLHAGIINAGGFLIIRFSPLVSLSPSAMNTLVIVGAVTAIFGSLVMQTQTSVKVSLAYSTVAQMGFMMLECGLGMFSAAMLHIIAHSIYKAHAFLSSGETVSRARTLMRQAKLFSMQRALFIASLAVFTALLTVTAVGVVMGSTLLSKPGSATLSYLFALGLVSLTSSLLEQHFSIMILVRFIARLAGVTALFYGLQLLVSSVFVGPLAQESAELEWTGLFLRLTVVFAFSVVAIVQMILPHARSGDFWIKIYVHLSNGLYINTLANQLAIRFWPSAAPRSKVPSYMPVYLSRGDS